MNSYKFLKFIFLLQSFMAIRHCDLVNRFQFLSRLQLLMNRSVEKPCGVLDWLAVTLLVSSLTSTHPSLIAMLSARLSTHVSRRRLHRRELSPALLPY